MSHRIAFLSAAAASLVLAALPRPAAAADYYEDGQGPAGFHGGRYDDEGDRLGPAPRPDWALRHPRGAPGPVVFDERDPGRRFEGEGPRRDVDAGPGGPVVFERPVSGAGPRFAGPRFDGPRFAGPPLGYGFADRPLPRYRAVSVPVDRDGYGAGYGGPDVGCTVEEAQSTTPAGWRKTVTHRTCYRR